jgi:outer membrane murein-binding lipoprotein Lpp
MTPTVAAMTVHRALTATVAALAAAGTLVSCSSATNDASTAPSPLNPQSKEALERSAHELDVRAARREDARAWEYYSQRCKDQIGSLENYSTVLDEFFKGRAPQFGGVTANVRGSSAQVVSIDKDPNAPASAILPRTWTFIDDVFEWYSEPPF